MSTTLMTTVVLDNILTILRTVKLPVSQPLIMLFTKVTMMQYPKIQQSKKLKTTQIFHHLSQLKIHVNPLDQRLNQGKGSQKMTIQM